MLSQKSEPKMLSMGNIAMLASGIGFGAIVGGKVEISATGPISPSEGNPSNDAKSLPMTGSRLGTVEAPLSMLCVSITEGAETSWVTGGGFVELEAMLTVLDTVTDDRLTVGITDS